MSCFIWCPCHSQSDHGLACVKGVKTKWSPQYNQESDAEETPLCRNCCQLRLRHRLEVHAVCQTPAAARKERTANPGRRWGVWSVQESVCFDAWAYKLHVFFFLFTWENGWNVEWVKKGKQMDINKSENLFRIQFYFSLAKSARPFMTPAADSSHKYRNADQRKGKKAQPLILTPPKAPPICTVSFLLSIFHSL